MITVAAIDHGGLIVVDGSVRSGHSVEYSRLRIILEIFYILLIIRLITC